jgi:hypothetical protein
MAEFENAMRLSPRASKQGMANALCWAGRPEEALLWARRAIQDRPDWNVTDRLLMGALWRRGASGVFLTGQALGVMWRAG